ncbi:probable serine/threonine-protein kinase drkD isoform X2 [Lytechinus pictus]|uniref:probable serine/threonine-protein kinase drkD isoform X2 n=1 Tax=Lytechinus pictus TaxID=7653 RepID=UPI0030B9F7F9
MDSKELPVFLKDVKSARVKQELCSILDPYLQNKDWMQLAGLMGFSHNDIAAFQLNLHRPGGSPSDVMLTTWDYENHTIEELYLKLYEMKHARCMTLLKDYVKPELHYLIQKVTNNDPVVPEQPAVNVGQPINQFQQGMASNIPPGHENQFPRSMSPMPPHMPHAHPLGQPSPQYLPQTHNHNQQQSSVRTPSTASYHSSNANIPLQPADPRMMMATRPQQVDYNAFQHPNYRQDYQGSRHPGNDLMRTPSEHPLGGPMRYQSHFSNDDNMAMPPPVSSECLPMSRQPDFQSIPHSDPSVKQSNTTAPSSVDKYLEATIQVPYEKLCKATENFSAARKLGSGAFGEVFHAQLDMIDVAIKRIIKNDNVKFNQSNIRGDQIKEIEALTKYRCKNIVCLASYSVGDDCICLIFDYMKNGSLEYQLEGRAPQGPLEWKRRHMIAEGAAMGIQYLHSIQNPPLIHQDIKSSNILLDENFVPKIADFGLARPGPTKGKEYTTLKTSVVFGTKAYLAPEFIRDPNRKLSKKLDVYSFGVVLLELVTGEKAGQAKRRFQANDLLWRCVERIMEANEGRPQAVVAEILQDPLCPAWPTRYMMGLVNLAMDCLKVFKHRPETEQVCQALSEMVGRIEEEDRHKSSRTQNYPVESSDPLEHGKAVESSDQITEDQGQYGASGRPGFHRWEGEIKEDPAKYEHYGGFRALANGPKVQGDVNAAERPRSAETVHNLPERRLDQIHDRSRMREDLGRDDMCERERQYQYQMQQQELYNQQMYGHRYLSPAVPGAGNPHMDRNAASSQSSMSPSPGSSYPSYLQSSSITSSSDASGARFQGTYMGHPQGIPQGRYGDHMDPRLRHPLNMPQQVMPESNYMVDGQYEYYGQHPGFGPPMGNPRLQVDGYHQRPDIREQGQQRLEHLNREGVAGSTQDGNLVAHNPPASASPSSNSATASSSSSSESPKGLVYPKMRTLNLEPISIQSSDSSDLTEDTSLSGSSKELPQNGSDGSTETNGQREHIGMLQSGREEGIKQHSDGHQREPGENTEPQTQPCH